MVAANKVQLIKLICTYLRDHADMLPQKLQMNDICMCTVQVLIIHLLT